jgi:hypothetical protein
MSVPALYFDKYHFGTPTDSASAILGAIAQKLPKLGFTDIQKGTTYVACRTKNSHAVIAIVGPWPQGSYAVVITAGDEAKTSLATLMDYVTHIAFL